MQHLRSEQYCGLPQEENGIYNIREKQRSLTRLLIHMCVLIKLFAPCVKIYPRMHVSTMVASTQCVQVLIQEIFRLGDSC